MTGSTKLRRYHASGLGRAGRDGAGRPRTPRRRDTRRRAGGQSSAVGDAASLIPAAIARTRPPALPEMSEPEVLRHYLRLSQMTLGMIGISLFGTCTMKYNPRVNEVVATRPEIAELHPYQDEDTLQGVFEVIHGFDMFLRELSGMDQFVFQAGGGAHAAYTSCLHHARLPRGRAASSRSVTRSSRRSRPTRVTRRRPRLPASR